MVGWQFLICFSLFYHSVLFFSLFLFLALFLQGETGWPGAQGPQGEKVFTSADIFIRFCVLYPLLAVL